MQHADKLERREPEPIARSDSSLRGCARVDHIRSMSKFVLVKVFITFSFVFSASIVSYWAYRVPLDRLYTENKWEVRHEWRESFIFRYARAIIHLTILPEESVRAIWKPLPAGRGSPWWDDGWPEHLRSLQPG